jgi:uncharacterized FAD-dependent dehydrogenase
MLQISEVRIPVEADEDALMRKVCHMLRVGQDQIQKVSIVRRSIDARKKPELYFCDTVGVALRDRHLEGTILKKSKHKNIMSFNPARYHFPGAEAAGNDVSPIVVGAGPAGLFCAYVLAQHGYHPLLLERGDEAQTRREKVSQFWSGDPLDPDSNVQFGEGGAGTFSDGKLNTGVHDRSGRNRFVLETFVKMGAPDDILYDAKPHLGTDRLVAIVRSLREEIIRLGGSVRFRTRVDDLILRDGAVRGVVTSDGTRIESDAVVLAIGHSARDTFKMLNGHGVPMEAKPFAVGVRVEHPQKIINLAQYGTADITHTGPAPYKLTNRCADGRGVYSFCMCPGGYVVNASSEPGHLAVNGMSYRARDGVNANSAIVVTVGPEDFLPFVPDAENQVLSGMYFQEELERRAFSLADGAVPVQRYADFRKSLERTGGSVRAGSTPSGGAVSGIGPVSPQIRGRFAAADVRSIFPDFAAADICESMERFGRKIRGFSDGDAVFSGVESRTSSPVRIVRGESGESPVRGLFPCGEGAGYAGGITSAAIDGIKTAEKIAEYRRNGDVKFSKIDF